MRAILKILSLAWPFRKFALLSILANLGMVLFSLISIPVLIPFLQMLLGQTPVVAGPQPTWAWDATAVQEWLNWQLSQIVQTQGPQASMIWLCCILVAVYFFKNLFRYLSSYFTTPLRSGIVLNLRQEMMQRMLKLSPGYFSEQRKGDLMSRIMADVLEVEISVASLLESLIRDPLTILGALALLLYLSPLLTLYVLLLIVLAGLLIGRLGRQLKRSSTQAQSALGQLAAQVEESIGGVRILQVFGGDGHQLKKYEAINNTYRKYNIKMWRRRDLASPMSEFLGICIVAILIWLGFRQVQVQDLTPASFIAFLYGFYTILEPAKHLSTASYNVQRGLAALVRIEEVSNAPITISDAPNALPIDQIKNGIEVQQVSFSYEERQILHDVSFSIPVGQVVALVGASGAGKSTLADLMARFYDINEGAITIDGTDIKQLRLTDLRNLMGIVTQEALLFNDTIYNNIACGWPLATPENVMAAAKEAFAHDFILASEAGYQTTVGDRGMKLSGGQKQRLTIARALLRNPQLLILDEATSALDAESERMVQKALLQLLQKRTALVIAHRLSTIQHADNIIVLSEGQIVEQGTHETLLAQNGHYAQLVQLQQL